MHACAYTHTHVRYVHACAYTDTHRHTHTYIYINTNKVTDSSILSHKKYRQKLVLSSMVTNKLLYVVGLIKLIKTDSIL